MREFGAFIVYKWDHGPCPDYQGVLISEVSLLVRCPDFRGLNVCTLMEPSMTLSLHKLPYMAYTRQHSC